MLIDGITTNYQQLERCREVAFSDEVAKARKVITMYKPRDKSLALFRIQAARHLEALTVRAVLKRKLRKEQREFIKPWLTDGNRMFVDFIAALNKAVGYTFIEIQEAP